MNIRDGFSLIETLAAVALLAIASIPLLEMTQALARSTIALQAATTRLEASLDAEARLRATQTFSPAFVDTQTVTASFGRDSVLGAPAQVGAFVPAGRHRGLNATLVALRSESIVVEGRPGRDVFYIAVRRRYENSEALLEETVFGLND